MPRKPDNLPRHEIIGLPVEVVDSTDKGRKGIKGRLVDETLKTVVVDTEKGEKTVPKKGSVFRFDLDGRKVEVEGDLLYGRPEDRIDKTVPGKWDYVRKV